MKTFILGALGATLVSVTAHAGLSFSDDFNGPSLDPTAWSTIMPNGSSSVVQSGGSVTTTARGILATVKDWSGPYVVEGSFTMLSDLEHFNVVLRSDMSSTNSFDERTGLIVTFVNDGNGISVQELTNPITSWKQVGTTGENGFALNTGQTYSFKIFDSGTHVDVSVNDNFVLGADTIYATGDKIGFYSREFPDTATRLDYVRISSVPEFGASAEYLLIAVSPLLVMQLMRRRSSYRMLGASITHVTQP